MRLKRFMSQESKPGVCGMCHKLEQDTWTFEPSIWDHIAATFRRRTAVAWTICRDCMWLEMMKMKGVTDE
jgi:hypothetical protein